VILVLLGILKQLGKGATTPHVLFSAYPLKSVVGGYYFYFESPQNNLVSVTDVMVTIAHSYFPNFSD
jgi:hypothetical protein